MRTCDVSAGGARLRLVSRSEREGAPAAAVPPAYGAAEGGVVLWLDRLGRFRARVARADADELAVTFEAGPRRRERIVEELTRWLNPGLAEDVASPHHRSAAATTATPDRGVPFLVSVLECSMDGARLACAGDPPPLGMWVRVGMTWGWVRAHHADGFDLAFGGSPPRPDAS